MKLNRMNCFRVLYLVPALVLSKMLAPALYAQSCQEATTLNIPGQNLGNNLNGDGGFNLIVNGNFSSTNSTIDGRVAVGGNFVFNGTGTGVGLSVGVNGNTSGSDDNLVVAGDYTNIVLADVRVKGNMKYGTHSNPSSKLPIHNASEGSNIQETGLIQFANVKTAFQTQSDNYASAGTTSGVAINGDGFVTLTGDGVTTNYNFNVTLASPSNNLSGVSFNNIPDGSTIVVNILNAGAISMSPKSGDPAFNMVNSNVVNTLFNFPNAAIIALTNFTLKGSMLAPRSSLNAQQGKVYGSVYIGENVNQAIGFEVLNGCNPTALPIKLAEFEASKIENVASLKWITSEEVNSDRFEIQKSRDGKQWKAIGSVAAVNEGVSQLKYSFIDKNVWNGENLYRLKMIDLDQTFSFSRVVNLNFDGKNELSYTYPNPASDRLYFSNEILNSAQMVEIMDVNGKKKYHTNTIEEFIDISNWAKGLYIVRYKTQQGNLHASKVLIK